MYNAAVARSRFSATNVESASGPRLIVMCFDRLDRDLAGALRAMDTGDHYETNLALGHAQDLLGEMAMMLDTDAWQHAGSLLAIYDYLLRLLAVANVKKDPALVQEAARHVAEIGEAFRTAERTAATGADTTGPTPAAHGAVAGQPQQLRRISVRA